MTQRAEFDVEIYAEVSCQVVRSKEGDYTTWHYLATDIGNIWFDNNKTLDPDIAVGKTMKLTVYRYSRGTHKAREGRKNKFLNVYLDNCHYV